VGLLKNELPNALAAAGYRSQGACRPLLALSEWALCLRRIVPTGQALVSIASTSIVGICKSCRPMGAVSPDEIN
jgi:hypothetical protein